MENLEYPAENWVTNNVFIFNFLAIFSFWNASKLIGSSVKRVLKEPAKISQTKITR